MIFNRSNIPETVEIDFDAFFTREEVIDILMAHLSKKEKFAREWEIDDVEIEADVPAESQARFTSFKLKGREIHKLTWPSWKGASSTPTPPVSEPSTPSNESPVENVSDPDQSGGPSDVPTENVPTS